MATTIKAWDVISGSLGKCYATINGNREDMIYVKNVEAKVRKEKTEIPVLGQTGKKHKARGWVGTGSISIYYTTTLFRNLMMDYMRTGKDVYFDMVVENNDPSSNIGRQTILLKGVNIDNVVMAKLDINNETLEERLDFTFNDVEIFRRFDRLIGE